MKQIFFKFNLQIVISVLQTTCAMIKESITEYFDNFETNKITNIPLFSFKPNRNPFEFLPPEKILFKDLRVSLKPKLTTDNHSTESLTDTIKRYANEFEFRKSSKLRILTHTMQYTMIYGLVIFGFYSRQFSGFKRLQHILKETGKNCLYAGSIFTVNELLYPFTYKFTNELRQKSIFSVGNVLSSIIVWPLVFLMEWNFLMSIRKTLFILAFAQYRDYQNETQRFYKLNPDHISTRSKIEGERIKHPCEDPFKKMVSSNNSRAQQERRQQEKQELQKNVLVQNKGQRIPSSHLYLTMPEIYRPPTEDEKLAHEVKASKKTKELLDQRGIDWITVEAPDEKLMEEKKQRRQKKSSWWPW